MWKEILQTPIAIVKKVCYNMEDRKDAGGLFSRHNCRKNFLGGLYGARYSKMV